METISNETRAERARRALDCYDGDGDWESDIQDLMVDLCHLAHQQTDQNVHELLGMTETHFESEK